MRGWDTGHDGGRRWCPCVGTVAVEAVVRIAVAALILVLVAAGRGGAQTQVARTVHNLSASGPGPLRENQRVGVCIFCHTPHNAHPTRALWNRDLPAVSYKLYESSTLAAQVGQPTGSSRLCLSCHDGILALSKLRAMPAGVSFAPLPALTGAKSLGLDLSDDHPISFVYDSALALRAGGLADPQMLPRSAPLDENSEMQCTSCHDPHEDRRPNFLRIDSRFGAACTVCHRLRYWKDSSHATSPATWHGSGEDPWPKDGFETVAENACMSCHRVHAAPHPQRLLAQPVEEGNCTICHDGSVARKNIEQEMLKPSRHPVELGRWVHDEAEDPATMPEHVTCVDCHNPHTAVASAFTSASGSPSALVLPGALRGTSGITIEGAGIKEARFEYEVCFKCHGLREPTTPGIVRVETTRNIRLKINPSNVSYHPIAAPGRNLGVFGLVPPYTASSMITCTDCHNNDQWMPGSSAPRGPHGSRFDPILQMQYIAEDPSPESYSSYALCYKCHDRGSLLFSSGGFPHKQHVIDQQASCAVCHDPHGARQSPHLINFMLMAKQGNPVVKPSQSGRLEYIPDPARPGHGTCYLLCHNAQHNPKSY